jgi:hypothetical protein
VPDVVFDRIDGDKKSVRYILVGTSLNRQLKDLQLPIGNWVKADARIRDKKPTFLIGSKESPAGRYYLVRTDPNQGDKLRSVKMGKMGRFTSKQVGKPDSDWTFECEVKNEQPGVWRLTPKEELKVGEYGLWASPVGDLFDFGIDG